MCCLGAVSTPPNQNQRGRGGQVKSVESQWRDYDVAMQPVV